MHLSWAFQCTILVPHDCLFFFFLQLFHSLSPPPTKKKKKKNIFSTYFKPA